MIDRWKSANTGRTTALVQTPPSTSVAKMKLDQRRVADLPAPNHTQARAIKACLFDPRITRICTDMDRHCGTAALRKRGMAVAYRSARFSLTSAGRIGHVVIGSMNFTKVCMALVRIEAGPDCGSALKRDPAHTHHKCLKLFREAAVSGVPIGADRDPLQPEIPE